MIGKFSVDDFCLFVVFLVSFCLNFFVIFIIVKYRRDDSFSSSFFKFALLLSIFDLIAMLSTWSLKIQQMGYFIDLFATMDPFLARLHKSVHAFAYVGQIASITLIMLNRFSVIVFPIRGPKVSQLVVQISRDLQQCILSVFPS